MAETQQQQTQTKPVQVSATPIIKYQARDGCDMALSFNNVRRYLVRGNAEAVNEQELMYFMGVCKSRRLNPFNGDCYLIKYGNDPAAIIVSIDYFRARARAQEDCRGWKQGVICKNAKGELRYSAGLVLDGEVLIGGWFEAKPDGWPEPSRHEVNLSGYIKKTRDGRITRFWQPENQPTQIAKVAEAQGLRRIWPDEFQKLYTEEEMPDVTVHESGPKQMGGNLQDQGKRLAEKLRDAKANGAAPPKDEWDDLADRFTEEPQPDAQPGPEAAPPAESLIPKSQSTSEIDAEKARDKAVADLRVIWDGMCPDKTNAAKDRALTDFVLKEFKKPLSALDEAKLRDVIALLQNRKSTETTDSLL